LRKWSYRKSLWLYLGLTILPGCCYASYFGGFFAYHLGLALLLAAGPSVTLGLFLAWLAGRYQSIKHIRWYVIGGTLSLLVALVALAEASAPIAAQSASPEGPAYFKALMSWCTSAFLGWAVLLIYPVLRKVTRASS
jgi:hypothetical protein